MIPVEQGYVRPEAGFKSPLPDQFAIDLYMVFYRSRYPTPCMARFLLHRGWKGRIAEINILHHPDRHQCLQRIVTHCFLWSSLRVRPTPSADAKRTVGGNLTIPKNCLTIIWRLFFSPGGCGEHFFPCLSVPTGYSCKTLLGLSLRYPLLPRMTAQPTHSLRTFQWAPFSWWLSICHSILLPLPGIWSLERSKGF